MAHGLASYEKQAKWKTVNRRFPGPPNALPETALKDGTEAAQRPDGGWGGYERSESSFQRGSEG